MKKLIALTAVLVALVSAASAAFDLSVFAPAVFNVTYDTENKSGTIFPLDTASYMANAMQTDNGNVVMCPSVYILDEETAVMALQLLYTASKGCTAEDAVFLAGEKSYTFSGISVSIGTGVKEDGQIAEGFMIGFGVDAFPLLDYISKNQDGKVSVRLDGSQSKVDFILNDTNTEGIRQFFDAYVQAGGLEQPAVNLEKFANAVTVR